MIARSIRLGLLLLAGAAAIPCGGADRSPDELLAAAEAGDRAAQYELAVHLAYRDDPPPDDAQATVWFRRAAEQGLPQAQFELGRGRQRERLRPGGRP